MQTQNSNKVGFKSRFGFIMATAGSAIGLGNLWGFPYKAGNGGGAAWILVYLLFVAIMGIVVMIAEMFIGLRSKANVVDSYQKVGRKKALGFVGIIGFLIPFIVSTYYVVIGGWSLKFALNSFTPIPEANNNGNFAVFANGGIEPILYAVIFLALVIIIISFGVRKGIERASKILMPTLFVLLVVVAIRSLTLGDGVGEGLSFFLMPDFSKLTWGNVLSAMGQSFFSLSLGMGIMISYGSYAKKQTNLGTSALMVCLLDVSIALLAGFAIFPAVFAFGESPNGGAGLIFQTLPKIFASMGGIGTLFSFMFFGLVVLAALTSLISLIEVCTQTLIEKTNLTRIKATCILAILIAIIASIVSLSIGSALEGNNFINVFGVNLLDLFDTIASKIMMPVASILACIAVGWIITPKNTIIEMQQFGCDFKGHKAWSFMVRYITPLIVTLVLIFGIIDLFTGNNSDVGTSGTAVAIIGLLLLAIIIAGYYLFKLVYPKLKLKFNLENKLKTDTKHKDNGSHKD